MVYGVVPWLAENASMMISLGELIHAADRGDDNVLLPGFDATNLEHLLAWTEIRTYCLNGPMRINYTKSGASVLASVLGGVLCIAGVVYATLAGPIVNADDSEQFTTVGPTMISWSVVGLWVLTKMSGIYNVQQNHQHLLRLFLQRVRASRAAAVQASPGSEDTLPRTYSTGSQAGQYVDTVTEQVKDLIVLIDREKDVPQVAGIAVTPQIVRLVFGYMIGGSVGALGSAFAELLSADASGMSSESV